MNKLALICILLGLGSFAYNTYTDSTRWNAQIVVKDLKGNIVKVRPYVACMAERHNENLTCRVESLR